MSAVVIPARYASSRFPGKALAKIGGVPMILHVAERCLRSKADRVIVATDDERILSVCESMEGLEVSMSDPSIPSGTDRAAAVTKYVDDDIVINVQGDEPFIDPELINALIDDLEANSAVNMNTACVLFAEGEDPGDPNSVKVVMDRDGFALYFSRLPIPYDRDVIGVDRYRHIGIYGYRKDFLQKFASLEPALMESAEKLEQLRAMESGERIRVIKTTYRPISVDTEEDLKKAEEYYKGLNNG
ncbi:3-deoxy-manno-octulosonate cytidylyltransferase [Limisalsivibrio acetivorans]|uniref:3-deoxy-manno-octulosonate cytidylyltransferase n=1 Tax=Limisalsivibrio acetivorans TaxID=1304888 RepID=UPI0003B5081D|nr:3-deoxy-manno-octulosonate cytidylyltransferase [Limisalsivibrio acetivorans]